MKMHKVLKNLITLDQSIKIYIPSTNDIDQPISNKKQVDEAMKLFSSLFGGTTQSDHFGGWLSKNGNIIKEKITIIESYCKQNTLEKNISQVYDFGLKLKKTMNQEAISLEVNNKLYFI